MTDEQRQDWARLVERASMAVRLRGANPAVQVTCDILLAVNAELEALRARVAQLEASERWKAAMIDAR